VCALAGYVLQGVLAGLWHVHFLPLLHRTNLSAIAHHDEMTQIITVIVDMYMYHFWRGLGTAFCLFLSSPA
jgi:hypothetical protein